LDEGVALFKATNTLTGQSLSLAYGSPEEIREME